MKTGMISFSDCHTVNGPFMSPFNMFFCSFFHKHTICCAFTSSVSIHGFVALDIMHVKNI